MLVTALIMPSRPYTILYVSIEDLRGNSLGTSTAQFEISKMTPEVSVIVNTIDQQQLAAYLLHYTVKRGVTSK